MLVVRLSWTTPAEQGVALVSDQEHPLIWIAPKPSRQLALGYDVPRDIVEAVRAWRHLRRLRRHPHVSVQRLRP